MEDPISQELWKLIDEFLETAVVLKEGKEEN